MGLTTRDRQPKPSFAAVADAFRRAPAFALPRTPRVSITVASYNGERTLKACLDSLQKLNYPDYEVLLVDDGSTDGTAKIAAQFPAVRYLRHEKNLGLSAARNTGIAAASGEIVAFTDSDCRADEDWLHYLVADLVAGSFVGTGGPNLLPTDDSTVAAAVMASPGGPAHVMLTDRQAEHIPGCNMAFYRWALLDMGGFDPVFHKAGDDVDLCWRLQQSGYKIGFSPSAFVWHYRRSTIGAYLRQQIGYGQAEAMLVQKHPENFNLFGNGVWRGRIYGPSKLGVELQPPVIYHGHFASAGFQKLYASGPSTTLMLCTTLEYYLCVVIPLGILSVILHHLIPLAAVSLLLPLSICALAAAQADLPSHRRAWWSRPLVALLFFLQPIARGWARYSNRLALPHGASNWSARESLDSLALRHGSVDLKEMRYWSRPRRERLDYVRSLLRRLDRLGWARNTDIGWSEFDVEICVSRWSRLQLTSVAEDHPGNQQLFRCRLVTRWSLAATLLFWAWLGLALLVIGLADTWRPWSWALLALAPAMIWYFGSDQRRLRSVVAVFLDQLATELGMEKTPGPESGAPPPPAQSKVSSGTPEARPRPRNPER